jgi:hypothetical protein
VTAIVKSAMGATIEASCSMSSGIASAVCRNIVMRRTRCVKEWSYVYIWGISSQRLAIAVALANLSNRDGHGCNQNGKVEISKHDSVAGATAAAATAASAREPAGCFCG